MKAKYMKYCAAVIVLACLSVQVHTAPQQWIVGVENTRYYPHYDVRDGQWVGYGAAVLEHFAQAAGYEFIYKPMPVERLFRSFVLGEIDFKYPASDQWKAKAKSGTNIIYSDPVIDYIDGINLLSNRLGKNIENIRSIGIVRGFSPVAWKDRIASGKVELIESDSFTGLIQLVRRGRIDALYANAEAVRHAFSELSELSDSSQHLALDQSLPYDSGSYRVATTNHGAIITQFNSWMESNPELLEKLRAEYFTVAQH